MGTRETFLLFLLSQEMLFFTFLILFSIIIKKNLTASKHNTLMSILYNFCNFVNLKETRIYERKKILFISSEVVPYMPQTEISTLTFNLPKLVNENGGQTRIFIPKYGNINERRHQLHEVIRLSGINLIIDDMDMPLIIKVASIPKENASLFY